MHLTEVFFQPLYYIGDLSFGFKFGLARRNADRSGTAQRSTDLPTNGTVTD